jgi:hypothetical protein
MRKTFFAELLLARFTTKANAAAVMGDLEEARCDKGEVWFWRSFFSVLLSSGWRSMGGYLVAAIAGGILVAYLQSAFFSSLTLHDWTATQRAWGSSISLLSGLTAMIAVYCSIRFGAKDAVSRLALGYALVGAIASTFWWRNEAVFVAMGIAVAIAMLSLLTQAGRRGFGFLATVTALHALIWPTVLTLSMTAGKHLLHSATAVLALLAFAYFAGAGLVCAACGWLHSRFLEERGKLTKGASLA